jgi:hypothetical protein
VAGFNSAVNFVSSIGSKLSDWLSQVPGRVVNAARDIGVEIIESVIDGVGTMAQAFRDFIWDWVTDQIGAVFSPVPAAEYVGGSIVASMITGLEENGRMFRESLRDSVNSWVGSVSGMEASIGVGISGLRGQIAGPPTLGTGGSVFSPQFVTNIYDRMDEEEFYFRVENVLREMQRRAGDQ